MEASKETYLRELGQLRLLVGYLGERGQFGWWSTSFLDSPSRQFLEPVFSKSFRLAQYHGLTEAARRLHDEHLNVGSYHLFRLPEEAEQDLHELVQATGESLFNEIPKNKEEALDKLRSLAGKIIPVSEGPVAIGSISELGNSKISKSLANSYCDAFSRSLKTYPYLVH